MTQKLTVHIPQKDIEYDIHIGAGLLASPALYQTCQIMASRLAIVADTNTEAFYGKQLQHFLSGQGLDVDLLSFQSGELYKTRHTKEWLEDQLLAKGFGRDTALIALGGGIVTDVTGFVASTYCRGIPYLMLPTSLLAMVDASIGGKTGVNVPTGKNMIGTIYQPHAIFMDSATLKSLPKDELKNGIVECIKHGVILDAAYFELLENHAQQVLELDLSFLEHVIFHSCRIKKCVVEEDERETGKRRLLNFGHTIGHALETLTHHAIPHGQAVAIGMLAESYLSMLLGHLSKASFDRIVTILNTYNIHTTLDSPLSPNDFLEAMKLDKKSVKSTPRFVLVKAIGTCLDCDGQYCQSVDVAVLKKTLDWICHVMRAH